MKTARLAGVLILTIHVTAAWPQENSAASGLSGHELSSEQWRARVEASRRTSENFVVRALTRAPEDFDPDKELARMSEERVLNDDSLRSGDIVSTRKGLFVFRGDQDHAREIEDFVPLAATPK